MVSIKNYDLDLLCYGRKRQEQAMLDFRKAMYKYYGLPYHDASHGGGKGSDNCALIALAHKINHMVFNIGCPLSVPDMLKRIVDDRVKRIKFPSDSAGSGNNAVGHFRWNWKVYTLDDYEILYLQKFIS